MWIPFSIEKLPYIELPVSINGIASAAIIDSGARRTILDSAFALRLGLRARPGFKGVGLTGQIFGAYADGLQIQLGDQTLANISAAVLDLSGIAAILGHPVELLIGHELFEANLVEIDFPASRLRLWPAGAEIDMGVTPFPLGKASDRLRTLPLQLLGQVETSAAIDLGSEIPLYLDPALVENTRLLERRPSSTSATIGAEGIELSRIAVLPSIELGGVRFTDVPVQVPTRWKFASPAVAGLPILNRFHMALDFESSQAWLRALPDMLEKPFPKDRSGIGAAPANDRLLVIHVAPGSPAAKAGLAAGDEIVLVNDQEIEDYLRSRKRVGHQPTGTIVNLRLSNGIAISLELEDYF